MSELTKNIVCSLSIKVQHESYGGEKYTSTDLFESESEMVPTSMDFEECQEVWKSLRLRVEDRIKERKEALIASLRKDPHPTTPKPLSSLSVAPERSRAYLGGEPISFRRLPHNSVPAKPKEEIPDTPEGAPF